MGFCTDAQYERFIQPGPTFRGAPRRRRDRPDQVLVLGLARRAADTLPDPQDRPGQPVEALATDLASLARWDDYTAAKETMFALTDTSFAPWTVVKSNDKKRARINAMRHVLGLFDYPGPRRVGGGHPGSAPARACLGGLRARRITFPDGVEDLTAEQGVGWGYVPWRAPSASSARASHRSSVSSSRA